MKPLNAITKVATLGADSSATAKGATSNGMEIGLTIAVFVLGGLGLDAWLGTKPAFTIGLFLFAAIGTGLRYYYRYCYEMDIHIERHRERMAQRTAASDARSGSDEPRTDEPRTDEPQPDEPRVEA